MDTGIPLFFSEIEYLLLETIPLETIMRVCFIDARNNFTYVFYFYYVFILVALGSSLVDSSYFCFNCFKPMFRYRQATKRSSQWHRGTF